MAGRILTMSDAHGVTNAEELRAWLRRLPTTRRALVAHGLSEVPAVEVDPRAPAVRARVNHGDWIADCPEPGCGAAMQLIDGQPFMCGKCLNATIGHLWRRVEWPLSRRSIEAQLVRQPVVAYRNWEDGISATALKDIIDLELSGEPPRRLATVPREDVPQMWPEQRRGGL